MTVYHVRSTPQPPELEGLWDGPTWARAETLDVAAFRPEGTSHRPRTTCKLLYDEQGLYGLFLVQDRYVRSVYTHFQDPVFQDSCVELFVQPKRDCGYFNFEFNCGGALLASYVTDPTRIGRRLKTALPLDVADDRRILRFHSAPDVVTPEVGDPLIWRLEFFIPFDVFERRIGALGRLAGQRWGANAYKCGDATSHPHWGAWAPVPAVNFHDPGSFGVFEFVSAGAEGRMPHADGAPLTL